MIERGLRELQQCGLELGASEQLEIALWEKSGAKHAATRPVLRQILVVGMQPLVVLVVEALVTWGEPAACLVARLAAHFSRAELEALDLVVGAAEQGSPPHYPTASFGVLVWAWLRVEVPWGDSLYSLRAQAMAMNLASREQEGP